MIARRAARAGVWAGALALAALCGGTPGPNARAQTPEPPPEPPLELDAAAPPAPAPPPEDEASSPLDLQAGLPQSFEARVEAAIAVDRVRLAGGREFVLPHLLSPGLWRPGAIEAERAAAAALADRTLGATVRVDLAAAARDRYARLRGRLRLADGTDLAVAMLAAGRAVTLAEPDAPPARLAALLAAEAEARAAGAGFWRDGFFRVAAAEPYDGPLDGFAIVEGVVARVGRAGRRVFLEFGADWRRDFTAGLDAGAARRFERAGVDLDALEGRVVRVRGWVRRWNGAFLDLETPAQLETP
ncbi:MAG: thermonuclease family protein [Marivibrio sp.]|uniref:thermonuclease family protein n=1 Tax=Marivibrio sp. TaxID=2039719 RepID=UPI0032EFD614